MDFITRLPPSGSDRADTIIVITDRLSKSVIFEAITSTITEAVAKRLLSSLVRYYSLPSVIVSDRGPQFVGYIWKRIYELLKIT